MEMQVVEKDRRQAPAQNRNLTFQKSFSDKHNINIKETIVCIFGILISVIAALTLVLIIKRWQYFLTSFFLKKTRPKSINSCFICIFYQTICTNT